MKTYICQICGDAYIGSEKPSECPFCGARSHFIKTGKESNPIVNQKIPARIATPARSDQPEKLRSTMLAGAVSSGEQSVAGGEISELSGRNLEETLALELDANLIYLCMANKADSYEIKAMYKRLAKVELEHAVIVCKIMDIALPKAGPQTCVEDKVKNFERTIELEDHAAKLYAGFAKVATETNIRILFTALAQVEEDHIKLIKNYL
jgi:rubrerythrin